MRRDSTEQISYHELAGKKVSCDSWNPHIVIYSIIHFLGKTNIWCSEQNST